VFHKKEFDEYKKSDMNSDVNSCRKQLFKALWNESFSKSVSSFEFILPGSFLIYHFFVFYF